MTSMSNHPAKSGFITLILGGGDPYGNRIPNISQRLNLSSRELLTSQVRRVPKAVSNLNWRRPMRSGGIS
jgi:hypothetical protein